MFQFVQLIIVNKGNRISILLHITSHARDLFTTTHDLFAILGFKSRKSCARTRLFEVFFYRILMAQVLFVNRLFFCRLNFVQEENEKKSSLSERFGELLYHNASFYLAENV